MKARAQKVRSTALVVKLSLLTCSHADQRGGELQAASETADYARRLDLQDRYLNSKCSLYFLRADKPKEAEDCMLLFTKVRPSPAASAVVECSLCAAIVEQEGDQTTNLFEMQCMWFELESGRRSVTSGAFSE